jgi:hypothetical protein
MMQCAKVLVAPTSTRTAAREERMAVFTLPPRVRIQIRASTRCAATRAFRRCLKEVGFAP